MQDNKEILELLQKIETSNQKQIKYTRIQCAAALLCLVCFAGIFFMVGGLLPQIKAVITDVPEIVQKVDVVLDNLETATQELAALDYVEMVENVNSLVTTGQSSLEETAAKLNSIDIEGLNKAIDTLTKVIEPMAKFFKVFE